MSEHIKHSNEHGRQHHESVGEHHKQHAERIREKIEKAHESAPHSDETVQELRSAAESHALAGKDIMHAENEASQQPATHYVDQKALKVDSFKKSMKQVRKNLSKPDKAFSQVIHTKSIENISEVGAKTVARPSGILGGGIVAFVGSAFLLYMSKHYGFEYNYFIFFMLFIGGFFVGMLVEMMLRTLFKHKKTA